ncbi:MAG TPA: SRPBCC domain-containing protein [Gryllotalpicola sp.]
MSSFTTAFEVAQPPERVFEAIRDVRGWWSGAIDGDTRELGDEFTYEVPGIHWCRFRVTQVDAPSRISWLVTDSWLTFPETKDEWTGTTVVFDVAEQDGLTRVTFTHEGLVPEFECYELCSSAWSGYIAGSLRHLILTGLGSPNPETPVGLTSPARR